MFSYPCNADGKDASAGISCNVSAAFHPSMNFQNKYMYKKTCSPEQQNYCDLTETIELMAKKKNI